MSKRTRLKTATVHIFPSPTKHDRRVAKSPHGDVAALDVPDPYEQGATITVLRSLRDDPLAGMHARNQIDNVQYLAGRYWQKAYELAEIGGARAIDYSAPKVDGGMIPQHTISDSQAKAMSDLTRTRRALGDYGSSLVHDVLGCHLTIKESAQRRMMTRQRELDFLGKRFLECLNTMAVIFRLVSA